MNDSKVPDRALIVASPHVERILAGEKTWEMRSKTCTIRGTIGLIRKGSGHVVGLVDIVAVKGPLTREELRSNCDKHGLTGERLDNPALAKWKIAWVLENPRPFAMPVAYVHPKGAQSWIRLDADTRRGIRAQMTRR